MLGRAALGPVPSLSPPEREFTFLSALPPPHPHPPPSHISHIHTVPCRCVYACSDLLCQGKLCNLQPGAIRAMSDIINQFPIDYINAVKIVRTHQLNIEISRWKDLLGKSISLQDFKNIFNRHHSWQNPFIKTKYVYISSLFINREILLIKLSTISSDCIVFLSGTYRDQVGSWFCSS